MTSTSRMNTSCLLTNSIQTSSFLALSGSFWYLSLSLSLSLSLRFFFVFVVIRIAHDMPSKK